MPHHAPVGVGDDRQQARASATPARSAAVPRGPVAPRILDPILALVEMIDLRVRGVTPLGPAAVLAVERHRHRGRDLVLEDGTTVRRGDRADIIHFVNRRLRELAGPSFQAAALRQARKDLAVLALDLAAAEASEPAVAYHGATLLAPYARRMGLEEVARSPTLWHRIEDWYLRSLLARWAPRGRDRFRAGHSSLAVREVWISAPHLIRRFGPARARSSVRPTAPDAEVSEGPSPEHQQQPDP